MVIQKKKEINTIHSLENSLVLFRYILSLFGVKSLDALSEFLKDPALEGYASNGTSKFAEELRNHSFIGIEISEDKLNLYDANIYNHTQYISQGRSSLIKWKYFQYLSLLFTEIYLDKYFTNKENLLHDIQKYHEEVFNLDPNTNHDISQYTIEDLNKVAFWSATGSGKTLLMHVNILQFRYYLSRARKKINKTILVTPNEGLTRQHLEEFNYSALIAQTFSKDEIDGLFEKQVIDVIEVTKLSDTDGEKSVSIDYFEDDNLVIVDEGHRGSSGDKWKKYRDQLSQNGFAFEYSATFGQAISSASSQNKRMEMLAEYAKATLFDYSYSHFYNDGFGKDYQILNMNQTWNQDSVHTYLTACLLNFYDQLRLYIDKEKELNSFNIERPLAIFVGSSVIAGTGIAADRDSSDVVMLLKFFQRFIKESSESIRNIERLLRGVDGLVNTHNHSIFSRSFRYLRSIKDLNYGDIYLDILRIVFHSDISGALLHLDNLRGVDGEIGMRVGNGEYFGVINVGEASKLCIKCQDAGIITSNKDFTNLSLFNTINNSDSNINILIGSKKFTEGWSSWRVSTMGLLNIGRSEGSQIIQLFGRGVRLKGFKMSLKRSSSLDSSLRPTKKPQYIQSLETLNVFGIRADYMEQFRIILEGMGLPGNDSDFKEFNLPIMPVVDLSKKKLKYLKLKDGYNFKKSQSITLNKGMLANQSPILINFYPKIQVLGSKNESDETGGNLNEEHLSKTHLSFVDWNKVYFDLIEFKYDHSWTNLNISVNNLKEICEDCSWYRLFIPSSFVEFHSFGSCVELWQVLVTLLLKAYAQKVYNTEKSKWMTDKLEVSCLSPDNPNFDEEYRLLVHRNLEDFYEKLDAIRQELSNHIFSKTIEIGSNHSFEALYIPTHIYQPLLYLNANDSNYKDNQGSRLIEIAPVPLNIGERNLLVDIQNYIASDLGRDFMKGKELFLLRNKSRKGIGFFDASGFYPDFILWLIVGKHQYISFVDPKGILHLKSFVDPKVELYKKIKDIEQTIGDKDITLNSYIISNTEIGEVRYWVEIKDKTLLDSNQESIFNEHHIYFQKGQKEVYVGRMLNSMIQNN